MRVLIVEDEPKMAALLRRGLVAEGAAVDLAAGGEEAIPRAEATDYDVIVLDVMLPESTVSRSASAYVRPGSGRRS